MNNSNKTRVAPLTAGKYLISPLTQALDNGWFACSVSIRSGNGTMTTDRVLRLTRLFKDAGHAAEYALAEGLRFIRPLADVLAPRPIPAF